MICIDCLCVQLCEYYYLLHYLNDAAGLLTLKIEDGVGGVMSSLGEHHVCFLIATWHILIRYLMLKWYNNSTSSFLSMKFRSRNGLFNSSKQEYLFSSNVNRSFFASVVLFLVWLCICAAPSNCENCEFLYLLDAIHKIMKLIFFGFNETVAIYFLKYSLQMESYLLLYHVTNRAIFSIRICSLAVSLWLQFFFFLTE